MLLEDAFEELRDVDRYVARKRRAEAVAREVSPGRVARLNYVAERFPHLSVDVAAATSRIPRPLLDETFEALGELSTRRWMRDHPAGLDYGRRMVTGPMRRRGRSVNGPAIGGYPHGWSVNQYERRTTKAPGLRVTEKGSGERLTPEEIEAEAEAFQAELLERQRSFDLPADRLSEESARQLAAHRQQLERAGQVDYVPRTPPEPEAGPSFGGSLIRGAQALTGTSPTFSEQRMETAGPAGEAFADTVRHAAMLADVPTQEFQGQVRNLYGFTHGRDVNWLEPQSDFLIATTTGYESGEGFLVDPESEVAQERRRREEQRGQIHGHNVTLGRWLADTTPFATDSKPWMMMSGLVDLGVQIADPTAFALGKSGKVATRVLGHGLFANPELYQKAGLWAGLRRTLAPPDAAHFLDSKDGVRATEWLTNNHSPFEVYRGLNRKVNFDLATRLADTRSLDETRGILEKELGTAIREVRTAKLTGFGNDPLTGARLGLTEAARTGKPMDMPIRGPIDAHDKDIVGREIESWLYNAGAADSDVEPIVSRIARTKDHVQLRAEIGQAMRAGDGLLARAGVEDEFLRSRLVRLHEETYEEGSHTWFDAATAQRQTDDAVAVGGEAAWDASAHLYLEHAPRYLTLPDARAIRRMVSKHPTIFGKDPTKALIVNQKTGKLRMPLAAVEAIQNEVWKPVTLITRIAWPIRVIAEEQVRMAVAGYESMFNHPVHFIAHQVARRGTDIKGSYLDEASEMKQAVVDARGGWVERSVATGRRVPFSKSIHERDAYVPSWGAEITKLANDPVASKVANTESLDDVKEWFSRGAGNRFRSGIARSHPGMMTSPEQADAYIESVARRIRQSTGGHDDLLEAVRTGKFRGRNIMDGSAADRQFIDELGSLVDEYGPDKLVGDEYRSLRGDGLQGLVQSWNRTVDRMFGLMMTERTNRLSRAPVFKQEYWREAERLAGFADADTRASIIRQAQAAGIDDDVIRRMQAMTNEGELNLDEVDLLAKGQALDRTKELLYDLSRKGRTMDAMRIIFPFGEAWREVVTRWMHPRDGLLWQNPKTIRRFQQLVQGARGEEFGEFMGAPDGQGFFWQNQWGEEVFMWPGTQLLTDKLIGVPVPLTGRVQGLSMFGTIMPGLGPVAQMPVGWFLQNRPGPQVAKEFMGNVLEIKLGPLGTVQEQVLPFGSVGASDQAEVGSLWNYSPPWVKAGIQALTGGDLNPKQWNQSVMEMAGALKATGDYGDTVDEQNRLYDDAQDAAKYWYAFKALAATSTPAAPDGEWMIETNNGKVLRAAALAEELREYREEDFDTADERFLEKYGPDVMAVLSTPMTTATIFEVPTTTDGVNWVMEHPGIEDKLPNTYGFFAPEGGDENFSLYNDNFRRGEAIRLDPKNWIRLLNHTRGNVEYARYVEEVGDQANTKVGKAYLKMRRDEIMEQFPGWRNDRGKLEKAPDATLVTELYRAVTLPEIRDTDAGRGLRDYLAARDEVEAYADSQGLAWPGSSKKMLPGRLWLDQRAQEIIEEHPGFQRVYDFILSRETEELEEVSGGS